MYIATYRGKKISWQKDICGGCFLSQRFNDSKCCHSGTEAADQTCLPLEVFKKKKKMLTSVPHYTQRHLPRLTPKCPLHCTEYDTDTSGIHTSTAVFQCTSPSIPSAATHRRLSAQTGALLFPRHARALQFMIRCGPSIH